MTFFRKQVLSCDCRHQLCLQIRGILDATVMSCIKAFFFCDTSYVRFKHLLAKHRGNRRFFIISSFSILTSYSSTYLIQMICPCCASPSWTVALLSRGQITRINYFQVAFHAVRQLVLPDTILGSYVSVIATVVKSCTW